MVYEFYPWKIDVSREKTIQYYQTEDMSAEKGINKLAENKLTKRQREFFSNLGIDISKILVQRKLACFELRFYIAGNIRGLPKSQKEAFENIFPITCPNDVELYVTDNFLSDIDGMAFRFKHPCSYFQDEVCDKWNCDFFYGMALIEDCDSNFMASDEFHQKYYDEMYDKIVRITLKDGQQITGLYNDEFYEDASILVSCNVVQIKDINKIELIPDKN